MTGAKISCIIPTWNSQRYIQTCIDSIYIDAEDSQTSLEVVVVDNGSEDSTPEILWDLKSNYSSLNAYFLDSNMGTTVARNLGIEKSRGKHLAFFDSDIEVKKGGLESLLSSIGKDDKIGIAAPRLVYSDGEVQPSFKRFPTLAIKALKFLPSSYTRGWALKRELYPQEEYSRANSELIEVDYCISAAWLVSREALEDVGTFDENIFYSPEDVDFCLRMWMKGWKVVVNPRAEFIHHGQRTSYKKAKIALSHLKGLVYYFHKYGYWFDRSKLYRRIGK